MVESIVGCKWSMTVLAELRRGHNRPSEIEQACPGLSAKVLNERLRKLLRYGLVERTSYPEVPPRVEYTLTPFGERFAALTDAVGQLQRELDGASADT